MRAPLELTQDCGRELPSNRRQHKGLMRKAAWPVINTTERLRVAFRCFGAAEFQSREGQGSMPARIPSGFELGGSDASENLCELSTCQSDAGCRARYCYLSY